MSQATATDPLAGLAHRRETIDPVAPYRLPRAVPDGVMQRNGGVLQRIACHDDQVVLLRAAQPRPGGPVVLGAWAPNEALAEQALERWRRSLGVDVDHRPFLQAAWRDPVLGPLVRRRPWLRPTVRYRAHEALLWAITEQLIEYVEAARIQRGLVRLAGHRCERTGLVDAPSPQAILDLAPARIEALGLAPRRVQLLRECCRLLVRGLDLEHPDREVAWRRLRAMPGLGAWTLSCLALRGQGETDASPSGDLGLLKSVGRLIHGPGGGIADLPHGRGVRAVDPAAPRHGPLAAMRDAGPVRRDRRERIPMATELEVHELVSRFSPWKGYAAEHLFAA